MAQTPAPLTSLGSPYTQNFDTLANTGTSSAVPAGWAFVETGTGGAVNGLYTAGTGSSNAGDTYSFGASGTTERALGGLLSGSITPTMGAAFTNNTGGTITSLTIAYTGEQWRVGTLGRTDQLDFQYSLDATDLATGTWVDVNNLDFVAPTTTGAVGLLDGNAAANRTVVTFTITGLNIASGATFRIRWNDFNASGSDDGLAVDDFSLTPNGTGGGGTTLSITDVTSNEGNAGTTNFAFTVMLSAPAGADGVTFDIATADDSAAAPGDYVAKALTGQSIPAGQSTYGFTVVVNGDLVAEANERFFVNVTNVTGATIADGQGAGMITNDDVALTPIHDIQGPGLVSALTGQTHTVEGIVVGDFQGAAGLSGFFVQEEDADADADPATSEGIFVFDTASPAVAVNVGDKVRVTGTVVEFNSSGIRLTELGGVSVSVVSTGDALPTATAIGFPVPAADFLERYEGMRVQINQPMTVTDTFTHGRFGELGLSANGRLFQPTHLVAPGAAAAAQQAVNDLNLIYLDDGSDDQNLTVLTPEGGLAANNTARVGEATDSPVIGILDHRFGIYRIQPTAATTFLTTLENPRPAAPGAVGGRIRAGAMNVLNYFTTLDTGAAVCGPTGGLDCRGANSAAELTRQRDKLLQAIHSLDAHVLGLIEIENNPGATVQDVVNGLNAINPGKYDYINTGAIGTDAIKVAIIYQPAVVTPVGGPAVLTNATNLGIIDSKNRPPLAQTFRPAQGAATILQHFTVVVNHFKSKGSDCNTPSAPGELTDPDTGDGQANCNLTRVSAAQALINWLATNPTNDPTVPASERKVLVVGDLNSYAMEDPISALTSTSFTKPPVVAAGNPNATYVDLAKAFHGPAAYSYNFAAQAGYLDYGLANRRLSKLVTGFTEWHINSDEPVAIDYNVEFKSAAQQALYYAPNQFRVSDHDPLLVGINPLCGDLNDDGKVTPVDGAVLFANFGRPVTAANRRLDFNGDGSIGLADVQPWNSCYVAYTLKSLF